MVSDEFQAIFIHINRTGGTSVEQALGHGGFQGDTFQDHREPKHILADIGEEKWNRYFKFSVVRNPWDKMVSMFHHRQQNFQNSWDSKVMQHEQMTFPTWIKLLPKLKHYPQHNLRNQLDWLGGPETMDYIARFESLADDWDVIRERIGCDVPLPRTNGSKHGHYREYYTPEARDLVARRFAKDIRHFGYSF